MNTPSLSEVVKALESAGLKQVDIAQAAKTSQPTINRIKKGASTSFEIGCALIGLYQERCPPAHQSGVCQARPEAAA
jgi:predicted XRE-type DNA-binding protein